MDQGGDLSTIPGRLAYRHSWEVVLDSGVANSASKVSQEVGQPLSLEPKGRLPE